MNKVIQDISLCKRAGKLILGFDVVKQSLVDNVAMLLVIASDVSPKTRKEVEFLSQKYKVKLVTINITLDELWYILGKRVGVISVIDKALSEKIAIDAQNEISNYEEEKL